MDDRLISQEKVFEGKIFSVFSEEWEDEEGKKFYRDVVRFKEVAAVLPVTKEGSIVLVRQYRHAVRKHLYEIPAGIVEEGESPDYCAKREVLEETGYRATSLKKLSESYTSPGIVDEKMHIFLAEVEKTGEGLSTDEDEKIQVIEISFDEAITMAKNDLIKDSKTLLALLMYDKGLFE